MTKNDPVVKAEPGIANGQGLHAYPPANAQRIMPSQGGVAAARATQALESQYGQRAAASISAIHSSMQVPVPGQQQVSRPGQAPPQQMPANAQQYQAQHDGADDGRPATRRSAAPAERSEWPPQSQMDGPSDFEGVLMQRDADGNQVGDGRVDIDSLIAEKIASRAKQMEGGGLMLPSARPAAIEASPKNAARPAQPSSTEKTMISGRRR